MSEAGLLSERQTALSFLFGRINYERTRSVPYNDREFKLARMRELIDRLGDPAAEMPIAHIAGTKGKGSTAAMVAGVLTAAGYRTGLFTSPHLYDIEERFVVDGRACTADDLCRLVERVRPAVEAMDAAALASDATSGRPTFFEITTAMALCHFAKRGVDAAVLEVGLGGRLDSTNVCQPLVTAITSISYDHTQQLGTTLAAIAREKAGIVKPEVPLVSGVTDAAARGSIADVCERLAAPLVEIGRDFDFCYYPAARSDALAPGTLDFDYRGRGTPHEYAALQLGLAGRHQAANAAVALAVVAQLREQGWRLTEESIRRGLAGAQLPARSEVIMREPTILVDAAHNVASVEALLDTLSDVSPRTSTLIFAASQDKDVRGMLRRLLPRFDRVILTRYGENPRCLAPEALAEIAAQESGQACLVCRDSAEAWDVVRPSLQRDELLCITGSFFLAAEMRKHFERRPPDAATAT